MYVIPQNGLLTLTQWQKKGLALDTLIPTPNGFTTMGEIRVGDKVFNALGKITTVIAKSEVKHLPCYKVTFQNGESFVCDHEHRWFVRGSSIRHNNEWGVVEVKDLYGVKKLGYPIVTPINPLVELQENTLPIPPYCLGYWIGNGSKANATMSCDYRDAEEITQYIAPFYKVSVSKDKRTNAATLNISSLTGLRSDNSSLKQALGREGLLENKHIPMEYKRGSVAQRIELIRGDSDGSVHKQRGRCIFGSTNADIATDVYEILSSLGERVCFMHKKARGFGKEVDFHEIQWQPRNFIPFHLTRKANKVRSRLVNECNSIKSIEIVPSVPTQCIAVDSGDASEEEDLRKSFLIGRGFYVTHNTVLKQLLTKYAPMSVEMQQGVQADQAVIRVDEEGNESLDYVDNSNNHSDFSQMAEEAVATEMPQEANDNAPLDMSPEQPKENTKTAKK